MINKLRIILLLMFVILFISICVSAEAKNIHLDCSGIKYSTIFWDLNAPEAKVGGSKDNVKIIVDTTAGHAILIGNVGTEKLIRMARNTYAEITMDGNMILWTFIIHDNGIYLYQYKAYDFAGPYSITTLYKCK